MENRKICDDVSDMNMYELAHNQVFVKDGEAWYRDYDREISARNLIREIYRKHIGAEEAEAIANDDTFDDVLLDAGYYGTDDLEGVCSILYTALWGMTEVREWLREYINSGVPAIKHPEVLQRAIDTWGTLAQTDMAIEEMSELTKAILKYRRAYGKAEGSAAEENIREEIADVFIMLAQLVIIFDRDGAVQREIDFKLNRLAERLGKLQEAAPGAGAGAAQSAT
jgi:NTP pyrophosphatase (non-canonical NTP hydrolase)